MPSSPLSQLIIAGALLLCALWHRQHYHPIKILLCGAFAGILWMILYCHSVLSLREVDEYSSLRGHTTPLTVRGKIISLVSSNGDWINIEVAEARTPSDWKPARRWRLGWERQQLPSGDNLPLPQIGEYWQFDVRPRAFPSVLNQGGFNQQRHLLARHITAKGYVFAATKLTPANDGRALLLHGLTTTLQHVDNGDILLALTMGERQLISAQRWQQLRQTGTGHLVAISGLHLSVVALWLYVCCRWLLLRCWPTPGRRNLLLAQVLALGGAGVYAWLAGFGIPVQRALLMLLALVLVNMSMRSVSAWERWLWALTCVLLLDPLAALSGGFWLSFLALALILLEWHRSEPQHNASWRQKLWHWCRQFWRIQWRLCLGLTLVQALLFGGVSLHSFWINLLLVPWFSVVVIPLSLLALLVWSLLQWWWPTAALKLFIWQLADGSLWPAAQLWQLSDQLPGSWSLLPWSLTLSLMFVLVVWVIWYWRPRRLFLWLPCLLLLPALLQAAQWHGWLMAKGWQLHVLDVGQGLAVVVQQGPRALLFDTGASFPSGFSYAERVILPFLAAAGVRQLDYLVISHGDNDHAGGAAVMLAAFPNSQLLTDVAGLPASQGCRPRQWRWQTLNLTLLAPEIAEPGNNGSCVLLISDAQHRVLLPGDIELVGEVALLRQPIAFNADILLAPHHGSKTSSSPDFIRGVRPSWVVFPAGLSNRWQFPRMEVRARYQLVNATQLVSGEQGQISFTLDARGITVASYRQQIAPYWYNRLFGFGNAVNPE
ncbi:DNA internalization-related competence protein ComEC/Rec2 [Shewanella dokdonensis]|nr:DNA internalization-related competence protein ComEC/Rec2 [Shewanella dokdonensis]MCL1075149.1 DNA internalization-related competence protein ComEC/Rec2 [Shewanella dokdonensis]